MKICLIGEYSYKQWQGSATHKVQKYLLKELSAGHNVTLLELTVSSSRLRKIFSAAVLKKTKYGNVISGGIISLAFVIIMGRYRIIHFIVNRNYMFFLAVISRLTSAGVVTTLHDTLALRSGMLNIDYFLKRWLCFISQIVLVYNKNDLRLIARFTDKRKGRIIRNGVDLTCFFPGPVNNNRLITFAGGTGSMIKGLAYLQAALKDLGMNNLQICGERRDNSPPADYLGELSQKQFADQLRMSRIVVIPSVYESFSITALEAMASGIPVIITRTSGITEYLKDGENCLMTDYGNIKDLQNKIMLMFNDKALYRRIRENALTAVKKFNWKNITDDYLKVYIELNGL